MKAARRDRPSFGAERRAASSAGPFGFAALLSLGAIAAALVTQHGLGMQPCPWCTLQRLIFLVIGAVALLGLAWRAPAGSRIASGAAFLLAGAGFAAAMWQHFVAIPTGACKLSLADRIVSATGLNELLPAVFEARASCAEAAVNLLGVPYEFWSATLFVILALAMLLAVRRA
ncbi:MAG: disulfide bond formation protein B [Caldimonas sp.]